MIKKQNLRINVLAAAVLAMTTAGAVQAAGLPTREPTRQAATAEPGAERIIVKYRAGSAAASDRSATLSTVQSALTRASLSGGTARAAALEPRVLRRLAVGADVIRLQGRLAPAELQRVLKELSADPSVQYAEADVKLRHTELRAGTEQKALVPNDPFYQQYQWHLHNAVGGINAPTAWDVSQGEGIVVAVIDTGVLPQHPDLAANLLEGYDFITDAETSRRPTDERVPGAQDYGDWVENDNECYSGSIAEPSSWHGSHVSGTVAEQTNNGVGMAGVAHKAKVLPVRVLGKCGGFLSDITDAITWASGGTVAGIPANTNPAEIINLSLGGRGSCSGAYQDAVNGAISRGTVVVVAAGNQADNAANYRPASCEGVITVGATRITGGITYYSNYGTRVDLSGPGGGGSVDGNPGGYVWQAGSSSDTTPEAGTPSYMGLGGTSMSSPHVAGIAALVQSALIAQGKAPLTPAAMRTLLKETARPFPVTIPASTPIGTGIVDAKAALDKALANPCTENCEPEGTPLTNKVPLSGVSGAAGSETVFRFEAQAGKPLSVLTYGGTGNVSLYLAQGRVPSASSNDARSTRPGNSETVRVNAPAAGTWYVKVVGEAAFSGVSVLATQ